MMKRIFILILVSCVVFSSANAEPFIEGLNLYWKDTASFRKPSIRFLNRDSYYKIDSTLKSQGIFLKHKPFYFSVIEQEELGYMGYHASSHDFRIFQDIIRITLEEVLDFEFKRDFHFFRVPCDPYVNNHVDAFDFLSKYKSVNDNLPEQRNQLLSANFTIFSNYDMKYECTAVFFEKVLSFKPPNFEIKISYLFNVLGMPPDYIHGLFQIGESVRNDRGGNLYQFFDFSHHNPYNRNTYEFIDSQCFPCEKKGEPLITNKALSDLFQSTHNTHFLRQYRLVFNNYESLNPYSPLHVRRYNLNDHVSEKNYENKLRKAIRKIPYDPLAAQAFKNQLEEYWNLR